MPFPAATQERFESTGQQPAVRVDVVSDYDAFLGLEPVWNQVAEGARIHQPFLEFCWARAWWETFGAGCRLHILVVRLDDEPIAIAPLMVSTERILGIRVRRLGFLYNSHVPRMDFLVAKRFELAYSAIWNAIRQDPNWDLLQLCQLPEESATTQMMRRLARDAGYTAETWASGESPYVAMDGNWAEYFGSLPTKHRSNLRNRLKRAGQLAGGQAGIRRETVTEPGDLAEALPEGFRIEAAAWKGQEGTAIECSEQLQSFYTRLAEEASRRGWLRLHFLQVGDQRVAFDYSLAYKNQVFLLKSGYLPEFSPYSPSGLLLTLVLEDSFEQGMERYDLLGDFVDWKRQWTSRGVPHCWLFIFSRSWRAQALRFLKFGVVPLAKRLTGRA